MKKLSDLNIQQVKPLASPNDLKHKIPVTRESEDAVFGSRKIIQDILEKKDTRLLGVVGPCSIHDPEAAMVYASRLQELSQRVKDTIFLVMRVYFEKPRTTLGWKGLITDPDLNGSYNIGKGLEIARSLLAKITETGLPVGSEMLDPIIPQYISDYISWAAIGARTTESQTHREMASGLSMPVGFKNGTSGNLKLAVDAIRSTHAGHSFIGIDQDGKTCVLSTRGNAGSHIILRGGRSGPNYYEEHVEDTEALFLEAGLKPSVMIDCSHGNSGKRPERQSRVLRNLTDQVVRGRSSITGFMLESNLVEGCQPIPESVADLTYGQSVTDACIGWEETQEIILEAAQRLSSV